MATARLNKLARELNVGITTMVEFLHKKGFSDVENNPNTKVNDEQYDLLMAEFSSDFSVKKESDKISEKRHNKERKETVILESGPHQQVEIDKKDEDQIPTVIPEDEKPSIKIVDKIDLNSIGKKHRKEEPVAEKTPVIEIVEEESEPENIEIANQVDNVVDESDLEESIVDDSEISEESDEEVSEDEVFEEFDESDEAEDEDFIPENTSDENADDQPVDEIFQPNKPKVESNINVVGKIDLSKINERTRPPKKSKEEKKKEREERNKKWNDDNKGPAKIAVKPTAKIVKNIVPKEKVESVDDDSIDKKKRKRIHKSNERVDISREGQNSGKKDNKKITKKGTRVLKPEISDEDVQKQVKETLARLTSQKGGKGDKHRRLKRKAIAETRQANIDRASEEQKVIKITEFVTVAELAAMMNVTPTQVISTCMSLGLFVSINQRLDAETISIVADEFEYAVEFVSVEVQEAIDEVEEEFNDNTPRPPIVTVMGHVDHGKTSLLDYIRSSNVIAGEAGGITQHIGAYNVGLADGRRITFLDTPGHEAFTAMRARGAKMTDVAIIIVAADDDVMPQSIEAINHASAAGVPIVFAINKIDKPNANPEKVKETLANMNYLVESWGGKYQSQDVSAKKGIGVEELLEKVLLEAELLDLKANPERPAMGSVVESTLDKGRGYVATLLVQNGTLKIGDVVLAGQYHGHVKAMFNERGQRVTTAGPSEPVLILGLNGAPTAGDNFNVMGSEKEAREIATKRAQLQREQGLRTHKHITLDEIGRRIAIGNFQELNVIVKGDVDGSIEALSDSLIKLSTEEIQVNVIHKAVGQISESDIMLATASNAIVVGFQVRPSMPARKLAEKEEIEIRLYSIIYDAIEEIKAAMEGMLSPEIKEEIVSTVEISEVFKITKVGTVAGCMVKEGKINRNDRIRLIRDGIVIYTGTLGSLKRFKDDVKEVATGYECGLNIANYNDIKVGDFVEAFREVEVKKKL